MTDEQIESIKEIYNGYTTIVQPFILNYEVMACAFPIELLNEIRSIFTHIARCYKDNVSEKVIDENIGKAKGHLKRAILDSFKYNLLVYQEKIKEFQKVHSRVLSVIDNGNFSREFYRLEKNAEKLLKNAKMIEVSADDVNESYATYEEAYNAYDELYRKARDKETDCKEVNGILDKDYKKKFKISLIFNGIMGLLTVASVVFGIIGMCLAL